MVDVGVGDDIEDPITSALSASDLQLLFLDLEFLDLASGPPANINAGQDKNKNKHNPTLGNYFPDIFFDTTGLDMGQDLRDSPKRPLLFEMIFS